MWKIESEKEQEKVSKLRTVSEFRRVLYEKSLSGGAFSNFRIKVCILTYYRIVSPCVNHCHLYCGFEKILWIRCVKHLRKLNSSIICEICFAHWFAFEFSSQFIKTFHLQFACSNPEILPPCCSIQLTRLTETTIKSFHEM